MFDMVSRRGFVSLSAVAAAGLGLAGCSGNKTSEPTGSDAGSAKASSKKAVELQVFAANSLEKALPEVQELYTEQTGTTFADTQFKASGDLVEQMRAGATVDVLITASKGTMDDAEAVELVDADTREDMFVNDLVIIRAEGSDTKIEAIADVANLDGKIAIGDAKTVPAGKYANQALASVGLYTGTEGDAHALGKLRGAHFAVSAHAFASFRSKAAARIVCARREKPCAARKCSFWIASRLPSVVYYFYDSFQIFFRSNGRGQV